MRNPIKVKPDRRFRRTKRLLQEAMVALTLEKGYDSVTIRDLTERADVGYATFFRHYADKDMLLEDVLEAMKDEFLGLIEPSLMFIDPEKTGALIFEYVRLNADLCRVLLDSSKTMAIVRTLRQMGMQENQQWLLSSSGQVPAEIAINHLMTSLMMLIRWWLENEMPYPPERMGRIAADLFIRPVLAVL